MNKSEFLKHFRKTTNGTQKQLAEKLAVNIRTIQRWESGERTCPDVVVKYLEMLLEDLEKEASHG